MKRLNPLNILFAVLAVFAGAGFLLTSGCNHGSSGNTNSNGTLTTPLANVTPISNCIVDSDQDVEIGGPDAKPGCDTVKMEPSFSNPASFDEIAINNGGTLYIEGGNGNLRSANTATINSTGTYLETPISEICIGNGGRLEFTKGTKGEPITSDHKVELTFDDKASGLGSTDICPNFHGKGIDVLAGGSLIMNGAKGVPAYGGVSWTTLAAPAGSNIPGAKVASTGSRILHLTADVTKGSSPGGVKEGWKPGDWIVVATTDYVPFHSEFVQISKIESNAPNPGSTVILKQPLKYYHFGSLAPSSATATCADPLDAGKTQPAFLCDGGATSGVDRNYGVDERAEVGLISRDIELSSTTDPDDPHRGGEIMIHAGFDKVEIRGVRLSKFGKDNLGSYPIHFHLVGDVNKSPNPGASNVLVDADSVDHSYNKCVTIHETSNVTISNLVCARIVGHIFYEELGSYNEDNVADDSGIVFDHDLGIGAMSNSFDINSVQVPAPGGKQKTIDRADLINDYWWAGDYMTNAECSPNECIKYNGFNIPDTDNQAQWVHGSCTRYAVDGSGSFGGYQDGLKPDSTGKMTFTPCDTPLVVGGISYPLYIEPASGFWVQNPNTVLENNAIAGCQGVGRGVWWVPPGHAINIKSPSATTVSSVDLKFQPLGHFQDNRVSACYSGYYDEPDASVHSEQLFPHLKGKQDQPAIIATLDGMTATRNRFRGVWLRPTWFVLKNSHFASNRENVTLVTSGGIDGNAPGVWDLLEDSVLIGFSENNIERWGPCPRGSSLGPQTGAEMGCIDHTPPYPGTKPHSGAELGQGYTPPSWNDFGYMLYDGPVLVFHDRFVNFNYDDPNTGNHEFSSELDTADRTFLETYETSNTSPTGEGPPAPYEGDAALGWFQSNQSAYPTGTESKELMWVNTNLRHQIYTEHVGVNTNFNDGDKNTAIIDEDGTLTGLGVKVGDPANQPNPVHPISLNNLPFNATSNSVDECLSRGGQNELYEGRDTSLISPAEMGTLEFSDLYPFLKNGTTNPADYPGDTNSHWQDMTFTRDDAVQLNNNGGTFHPQMVMRTGRNGLGIWEPKVSNGFGYTVRVSKTTAPSVPPAQNSQKAGLWKWIEVGLADVVDPNISATHPFYVQLGINYTNKDGSHPADNFTILRGYKSYVGGNTWPNDPELLKYWTPLGCNNLDSLNIANVPWSGNSYSGTCPAGTTTSLTEVSSIGGLKNSDGTPNLNVYYYNAATGYLYLNVAQNEPNPVGPSPMGSCDSQYDGGQPDPSCPDWMHGKTYYVCPVKGCIIYAIEQNDPAYDPGPSAGQPNPANLKPAPVNQNKLRVITGSNAGTIVAPAFATDNQGIPYHTATNGPTCTATEPQL